jgi:hypothetical protein
MKLQMLSQDFSVCKIKDYTMVDFTDPFVFLSKTDEEFSLVCQTNSIPGMPLSEEHGFKAFRIEGTLDFDLVGVISKLTKVLSDEGISVFVVSTYNTDYVFVKKASLQKTITLLEQSGYEWKQ